MMAEYYNRTTLITEIPAPDDLMQGGYVADVVNLGAAGDYKRGLLLMSGEDSFIPATSAGIATAKEVCICAENISFEEGVAAVAAYFGGTVTAQRLILSYETSDDDHDVLIEAIRPVLRAHKLFLV